MVASERGLAASVLIGSGICGLIRRLRAVPELWVCCRS